MPRILIVDDNADNRDSLARRLRRRGFEVGLAVDGASGVDSAREEPPDLILMDMNMPGVDGWEATRQIKATPGLEDVPIIALTAYAMPGDRERALECGCHDYHSKPIEFEQLNGQIEETLRADG